MVRNIIVFFVILIFVQSCSQTYTISKDKYGELILDEKAQYSFTRIPSSDDLKKMDTTAYYVQIFEGRYYNEGEQKNPQIIIFHNDGFFKSESLLYFGNFDAYRGKNSVYYGGRYSIENKTIKMEVFAQYPGYKKWYKRIYEGHIDGDKIVFNDKNAIMVFEKRKKIAKKR